jgi:hypothetical protein
VVEATRVVELVETNGQSDLDKLDHPDTREAERA